MWGNCKTQRDTPFTALWNHLCHWISWQIPIILSDNHWWTKFSLVRGTRLPSPAEQQIQVSAIWSWKHVPEDPWTPASSSLRTWSEASSSTSRERLMQGATCAQGHSMDRAWNRSSTIWQSNQVKWSPLCACCRVCSVFFMKVQMYTCPTYQCLMSLPWSRCISLHKWFGRAIRLCLSPATPLMSMERSPWIGPSHLARWDPSVSSWQYAVKLVEVPTKCWHS